MDEQIFMTMPDFDLNSLVRDNIRKMTPYSSARSLYTRGTLLDANESPYDLFGESEAEGNTGLNRYPDGANPGIRKALSNIFAVPVDMISVGNGSDEIIDLLIRIFCRPQLDSIAIFEPTFGMYRVAAEMNDVAVLSIPMQHNDLDVDALKAAQNPGLKIVFLCNPNNPTGTIYSRDKIRALLALPCIVVLDEAYGEFAPTESFIPELAQHPNLVILKTLSKAYSMAGARLGIALASSGISALLAKVKMPYNISVPATRAVLVALQDTSRVGKLVQELIDRRLNLEKELLSLPLVSEILPSHTNFLCVRFTDAGSVFGSLLAEGIVLRKLHGPHLEGFIRISIGTKEENEALLNHLRALSASL